MYIKIIFKSLGVTYLAQFAADYCKDCGENAIASQVILAGKISVWLVISLPLFKAFIEIVKSLIVYFGKPEGKNEKDHSFAR